MHYMNICIAIIHWRCRNFKMFTHLDLNLKYCRPHHRMSSCIRWIGHIGRKRREGSYTLTGLLITESNLLYIQLHSTLLLYELRCVCDAAEALDKCLNNILSTSYIIIHCHTIYGELRLNEEECSTLVQLPAVQLVAEWRKTLVRRQLVEKDISYYPVIRRDAYKQRISILRLGMGDLHPKNQFFLPLFTEHFELVFDLDYYNCNWKLLKLKIQMIQLLKWELWIHKYM